MYLGKDTMINWKRVSLISLITLFVIFAVSCNRNDDQIMIHIFAYGNPAIPDSVNWADEDGWEPLLELDLDSSDLLITEDDIVHYDWNSHTLLLDGDSRPPAEDENLDFSAFVLTLGETPIIGGVVLSEISAVRTNIPVIYYSPVIYPEGTELELKLRASTGFNASSLFSKIDPVIAERIRQRMLEIGKLEE